MRVAIVSAFAAAALAGARGTPVSERLDSALDDAGPLLAARPGLTAEGRQARACALGAVRGLRGAQRALARGDRREARWADARER